MGLGQRRGRARAARHHHRRHHRNHHHHGHARVNLGGMFFRGGGAGGHSPGHLVQRRMWSGLVMIMVGMAMFMYGVVTMGITSSSYFGYCYQGIIFMVIGAVLTLTGIILMVKMYHLYRSAQGNANAQGQGSTVVVQSGTGMTATSNMQLQQNTSTVWMTGQSGAVPPPPPGYGQPQQGYPMGYPQGSYPPGGQPMYPPPNGQQPYNQPPPPGGAPPPVGGVDPPPQVWQAGMQPAPTNDGPQPPQVYQVQPAYPQPNQMNAHPPVDASGPQGYAGADAPPPSYDEATKTQHIP